MRGNLYLMLVIFRFRLYTQWVLITSLRLLSGTGNDRKLCSEACRLHD